MLNPRLMLMPNPNPPPPLARAVACDTARAARESTTTMAKRFILISPETGGVRRKRLPTGEPFAPIHSTMPDPALGGKVGLGKLGVWRHPHPVTLGGTRITEFPMRGPNAVNLG